MTAAKRKAPGSGGPEAAGTCQAWAGGCCCWSWPWRRVPPRAEPPRTDRPTGNAASSPASSPALTVTSTLDGHTSCPSDPLAGLPSAPAADVSEVNFLIDGRLGWVEHDAPYFYGDDGNWLVTSFLNARRAHLHRAGDHRRRAHGHRHGPGVGHRAPGSAASPARRHVGAPGYPC